MNRIYLLDTVNTLLPDSGDFSSYRTEKLERATGEKRKKEIIGGSILLQNALSDLGLYEKDICYRENENGKPYFKNLPFYFNLSHTDGYIMCAVSDEEVGCDIQIHREVSFNISKKYFSAEESEYIKDSRSRFFRLWVLKESLLKADGKGIADIKSASFSFADGEPYINGYSFFEFGNNGFSAAVCTKKRKSFTVTTVKL